MLRDHFHSPLADQHDWRSFHFAWATFLATDLNRQLPIGWYAAPSVEFGIEIDVGAWQDRASSLASEHPLEPSEWTSESRQWEVPAPTLTLDFPLVTDSIEVHVFDQTEGRLLVGGIELVSPANKDRQESREAFVTKCEAKLREGVGMVVVDVVTPRYANLHQLLLQRIGYENGGISQRLFAASYHPTMRDEQTVLDIFHQLLAIGQPLPQMPLHLKNGPCLQVDLPGTYEQTRTSLRIS
jgi:hypothetical protein